MVRSALLLPLLILAGCSSRADDTGSVSPEEDRMLNDAASSLDANYTAPPDAGPDANAIVSENAQ
ncbi:hypothetical protein FPZ24_04060 [Sphingomonas panacisoli]|uniref:Argininosuccinate lyase n=1 Tax=Sphingomonas panacisoli TaxID=1813879 RepID=A0A5B8LFB0_9SPHN|nr:hypothetical protein [Sphingomonas panacisoli]QDZ06753.1 hypothetical protein FPZ24_04060 [Sphingomonas panacisoli]